MKTALGLASMTSIAVFLGCDLGSPAPDSAAMGADSAMLRIMLTDAPFDAQSVFVTFSEVAVHHCRQGASDDGVGEGAQDDFVEEDQPPADACQWVTVVHDPVTLDLLELRDGITTELGSVALPIGHVLQARLMLEEASVVIAGETHDLRIPSADRTGLKIALGSPLEAGTETVLTLDFDAGESVHYSPGQGWMMRPVIHVISESMEPMGPSEGDETGGEDPRNDDNGADGDEVDDTDIVPR